MRGVHWFRNDLRLRDNTALRRAARECDELLLVFVLDERLLAGPASGAPRTRFLLETLGRLHADSRAAGSQLVLREGAPEDVIPRLLEEARAERLYFNRDTTPFAHQRDARVEAAAERLGVSVVTEKDRVVFEAPEVVKPDDHGYVVYTPYQRRWFQQLREHPLPPQPAPRLPRTPARVGSVAIPKPAAGGTTLPTAGSAAARRRLMRFLDSTVGDYAEARDLPAVDGTSRLSPYLRFGAVSIRECVYEARDAGHQERRLTAGARKWIDELVWRDFYAAILEAHPRVLTRSFRPEYEALDWISDEDEIAAWQSGRTGYPIVDAGMRQLLATGWMHNRVRMIAASFLTKDLLADWRIGERFFFQHLVDGDPASNNGGWQWAASTGTDAQPYFRIFNPVAQGRRFDPTGAYVRRFVPELQQVPDRHVHEPWNAPSPPPDYPPPIVDHAVRRLEALRRFEAAREQAGPGPPGPLPEPGA